MSPRADVLQGTLDMLILKALATEANHGFGVARWIETVTGGDLQVEEGALYPSLYRMEQKGWVAAKWGISENNRRAKFYRLTRAGRTALRDQIARWNTSAAAVAQVIEYAD